jgi:hypothetical protein
LEVPTVVEVAREVWQWSKADWKGLNRELASTDWETLLYIGDEAFQELPGEATARFTDFLVTTARKYVPVETKYLQKATHPWLNNKCRELVAEAHAAVGTHRHAEKLRVCSDGIVKEYYAYVARTKEN